MENIRIYLYIYALVGGDWNMLFFQIYWKCHQPSPLTLISFRGVVMPPTSDGWGLVLKCSEYWWICHSISPITVIWIDYLKSHEIALTPEKNIDFKATAMRCQGDTFSDHGFTCLIMISHVNLSIYRDAILRHIKVLDGSFIVSVSLCLHLKYHHCAWLKFMRPINRTRSMEYSNI